MCYKQKCKVVSLNLAHPVIVSVRLLTTAPSIQQKAPHDLIIL